MNKVKKVDHVDKLVLALAKTLVVIAFILLLSTLFSCTSKDLECSPIQAMETVGEINFIKVDGELLTVDIKSFKAYNVGDLFCK